MRRIAVELAVLDHPVSAATVQRYRRDRPPSFSWRTFLQLHAPDIWAADFFTVQTLTFQTYYVFLAITTTADVSCTGTSPAIRTPSGYGGKSWRRRSGTCIPAS